MKTLYFLGLLLLSSTLVSAQGNLYLKINHQLGDNSFAFNAAATNNLNHAFEATRLEYYISQIKVTHDGGIVESISNTWILVDAGAPTNINLGANIYTNIESISFGIGVEKDVNHLDPGQYSQGHPLGYQMPSMHWGWTSGYRFVAMEGKSGVGLAQNFEFHALGDDNYFTIDIATAGTSNGQDKTIELNANYEMALLNLNLNVGPIVHGEDGLATDLLWNFKNYVFYPIDGVAPVSVGELTAQAAELNVFPNPVANNSNFTLQGEFESGATVQITDLLGKTIAAYTWSEENLRQVKLTESGVFLVSVWDESKLLSTQKVVVY